MAHAKRTVAGSPAIILSVWTLFTVASALFAGGLRAEGPIVSYGAAPDAVPGAVLVTADADGEPSGRILPLETMRRRFERFSRDDRELYGNAYSNATAHLSVGTQIPLFECPDEDIERTYYFRWWTYRKHLRRAGDGWVVTEFLPDVPWAGSNNTISCAMGHHILEGRWLRKAEWLDGYIRFMAEKGTINGPRSYSCWPAWATMERAKVTGDTSLAKSLLHAFAANYETWEKGWTAPNGFRTGLTDGLFHQRGNNEGTEYALSKDGARPMSNAAMWAEAGAISHIARLAGDAALAERFGAKAAALEKEIETRLWNPEKRFFTSIGVDGKIDGVCELHGYAPFYFGMPLGREYAAAWKPLMDEAGFHAPAGLTFPRRDTPGFNATPDWSKHECLWDGPSWPYATSVALTALYRSLQGADAGSLPVSAGDFAALMHQYAAQHVIKLEDGRTVHWIDENLNPFTGEWQARRILIEQDRRGIRKMRYPERGKDYNHSTFCDLVIAGLCGFVPQENGSVVVKPLAPESWDWWCVDGIRYHGHDVTVLFDRTGNRYGRGKGLSVLVDGKACKHTSS